MNLFKLLILTLGLTICAYKSDGQIVLNAKSDTSANRTVHKKKLLPEALIISRPEWWDTITRHYVLSLNLWLAAPSLKAEFRINKSFSAGVYMKPRFLDLHGLRLEPFGRWYPFKKAPAGFFVQVKAIAGVYRIYNRAESGWPQADNSGGLINIIIVDPTWPVAYLPDKIFATFGAGGGVGYQWLAGKRKHFVFEVFIDGQYSYSTLYMLPGIFPDQISDYNFPVDFCFKLGGAF